MPGMAFSAQRPRFGVGRLAERIGRLALRIETALEVRRERRMLLGLDDSALRDMGFNRGQVYSEASRRCWDVPAERLQP